MAVVAPSGVHSVAWAVVGANSSGWAELKENAVEHRWSCVVPTDNFSCKSEDTGTVLRTQLAVL